MPKDFYTAVKLNSPKLSDREKKIADYILENFDSLRNSTIQEIADSTDSSTSSLSRLVRKLGFANFHAMKMSLNDSNVSQLIENVVLPARISLENTPSEIENIVFHNGIKSLSATKNINDDESLLHATNILSKSIRCVFFGLGGSSVVTLNAYHRFLKSSLICSNPIDFHIMLLEATRLGKDDCALVVSHSGYNKDMLEVVDILVKNNVKIISISGNSHSPLSQNSDCALYSISEETDYQPEGMSSMISQILLIDTLFLVYSVSIDHNQQYFANARAMISKTRD